MKCACFQDTSELILQDPSSNPGLNPGSDPSSDPGSNPGSNPSSDPGSNPGSNPGSDSGSKFRYPQARRIPDETSVLTLFCWLLIRYNYGLTNHHLWFPRLAEFHGER